MSVDENNNDSNKVAPKPRFGIMFDIDGVLLRGKTPVPDAADALKSLMDFGGQNFEVPCVFCTNGFGLREVKAATLSERLGVQISPDQLVMSQTPLEMFHEYHDKWCLVSGPEHDGGSKKVAEDLGFRKIITIEQLRNAYPYLDWVDRKRWPSTPQHDDEDFPAIEAIVLLGEPIRWETNLQLIIDVLLTGGKPNRTPEPECKQLPVLAVNMDLQWMAKASMPRFGHGAFLVCLENLFKKITGNDLKYTALVGKPSEITYEYSQKLIEEIATANNIPKLETVYAIGDNPLTDIYGANMFNLFLKKKRNEIEIKKLEQKLSRSPLIARKVQTQKSVEVEPESTHSHFAINGDITNVRGIKRCTSFLVCTGVYRPNAATVRRLSMPEDGLCNACASYLAVTTDEGHKMDVDHGHRDLPYTDEMTRADYIAHDVKTAIDKIFEIERWNPTNI